MSNPINTIPIQQFIQQVKAADLSQQREIKMDIKIDIDIKIAIFNVSFLEIKEIK